MSGEFLTTHFYENKTLLIRDDTLDTALVEGIEMELGKLKRLLQRTNEVFFFWLCFFRIQLSLIQHAVIRLRQVTKSYTHASTFLCG